MDIVTQKETNINRTA